MRENWKTIVGNKQRNPYRGDVNYISPTITAACGMGGMTPMLTDATIEETKTDNFMEQERKKIELPSELQGKRFRIRKLTPRECMRLMAVDDKDIDKMIESGLSNSSMYKLAGNSIVAGGNYVDSNGNVDGVLYNLFRKMFIDTERDAEKGQVVQLTMF